jgi:hypothetical protein
MVKGLHPLHGPVERLRIKQVPFDPRDTGAPGRKIGGMGRGTMKTSNGNPLGDEEVGDPSPHKSGGSGHKRKGGRRRRTHRIYHITRKRTS